MDTLLQCFKVIVVLFLIHQALQFRLIGDLGSLVIAAFANPALPYKPQVDFAPISLVTSVSIVVTANLKSPDGLIEWNLADRHGPVPQTADGMRGHLDPILIGGDRCLLGCVIHQSASSPCVDFFRRLRIS